MDKITKLSQAIRLGATFRPEIRSAFLLHCGSCAIGAACEAVGITPDNRPISPDELYKALRLRFNLPISYLKVLSLRHQDGETREQIADWLEEQGL